MKNAALETLLQTAILGSKLNEEKLKSLERELETLKNVDNNL